MLPWRRRPEWRLPADSWLPGHSPAQEARCAASGKYSRTSAPISEMTAAAASGPMPGMVFSSSRWARKGSIIASICSSSFAIIASRWPMWSRCRRHIKAWWSPKRPSSAMDRSGILDRILPLARLASAAGRRSPSISASIIARPDLVATEEATESILIPASCSTLPEPLHLRGPRLHDLGPVPYDMSRSRLGCPLAHGTCPGRGHCRQPHARITHCHTTADRDPQLRAPRSRANDGRINGRADGGRTLGQPR